jgi:abhydrolase domain-containing protein 6
MNQSCTFKARCSPEILLSFPHLTKFLMKKLILGLLTFILMLSGLVNYIVVDGSILASNCSITAYSIPIGTGKVSYTQVGTGPPILLLHGLFASKEQWHSLSCQLSQAGYRAIAPDLPGYGNSKGFTVKHYALEHQAALLHQFMERLGIQSFQIAGSSMGGTIATLYSQLYAQQVQSLALLGSPMGVTGWADSVRKSIVEGINPFIPITKAQFDREIGLLFVNPLSISDAVKMKQVNDYVTRNRHYQQVWDIVNLYHDALCQAPRIKVPTLVIWGQEDKIYDIRGVDRLQRCIPGSQIVRLPKAGHLPIVENTQQVASHYLSFLKAVTTRSNSY